MDNYRGTKVICAVVLVAMAILAIMWARDARGDELRPGTVVVYSDGSDAVGAAQAAYALGGTASIAGPNACRPAQAYMTAVWYVPTYENTSVLLIAYCVDTSSVWYISWFDGEQPELWDWYEIQNTAGKLLRG